MGSIKSLTTSDGTEDFFDFLDVIFHLIQSTWPRSRLAASLQASKTAGFPFAGKNSCHELLEPALARGKWRVVIACYSTKQGPHEQLPLPTLWAAPMGQRETLPLAQPNPLAPFFPRSLFDPLSSCSYGRCCLQLLYDLSRPAIYPPPYKDTLSLSVSLTHTPIQRLHNDRA